MNEPAPRPASAPSGEHRQIARRAGIVAAELECCDRLTAGDRVGAALQVGPQSGTALIAIIGRLREQPRHQLADESRMICRDCA